MQQLPAAAGLDLANWNWKVVHRFVWERFGLSLCRSSCLTYLRRLGFAFKRPKKRLLKADEEKREAFVAAYAALREEAVGSGAKIFFADEAHFRADAEFAGPVGAAGRASPGELQQSAVWRESQLLFGGVSGDGRGGMDGPGGKQQQRNLGSLFGPVAPEALWAASGNLG